MSAPAQKNLSPAPVSIRTWTDSSMRASRMCESSHQDYQYFFQNGQDQTTKTIRFPSFSSELPEMFPKPSQMGRSNARLPPTGSPLHYPMLRVCPANQRTPTRRLCRTWTARLSLPSTGTEPGSKPAQDPIRPAAPAAVEDRSAGGAGTEAT